MDLPGATDRVNKGWANDNPLNLLSNPNYKKFTKRFFYLKRILILVSYRSVRGALTKGKLEEIR